MSRSRVTHPDLTIVKLGGSLAKGGNLRGWLAACRDSLLPIIIVPGGGPFADAVRDAQNYIGFEDRTAHRMALLAMAQYAEALSLIEPGFVVASGRDALTDAVSGATIPIWSPLDVLDGAPGIEESWDFTSDSLAAWLALELNVKTLVLVKRAQPPAKLPSLADMVSAGIVDSAFPRIIDGSTLRTIWLGASDPMELHRVLEAATTETFYSESEAVA